MLAHVYYACADRLRTVMNKIEAAECLQALIFERSLEYCSVVYETVAEALV